MTRYFTMHVENPQPRIVNQAVSALQAGDLIAYPTDSSYAFGCTLNNRTKLETIRRVRNLQPKHPLTLICSDIAQISQYALLTNNSFYYVKRLTPGPYTFILPATKTCPKLIVGNKRKEVGVRIPDHPIALALVEALGEPLLTSTLMLPGDEGPIEDPHDIPHTAAKCVNLVLDGGILVNNPTTVVDLLSDTPKIERYGAGDTSMFSE